MKALLITDLNKIWLLLSNGIVEEFNARSLGSWKPLYKSSVQECIEYIKNYRELVGELALLNADIDQQNSDIQIKPWRIKNKTYSELFEQFLLKCRIANISVDYTDYGTGYIEVKHLQSSGGTVLQNLVLPDSTTKFNCSVDSVSNILKLGQFTIDLTGEISSSVKQLSFGAYFYKFREGLLLPGCSLEELVFPIGLNQIDALSLANATKLRRLDFSACEHLTVMPRLFKLEANQLEEILLPPNLDYYEVWTFGKLSNIRHIHVPKTIDLVKVMHIDPNLKHRVEDKQCEIHFY